MKITINKPAEFEAVYLKVDAGVRYWEDGRINGKEDTDCEEADCPPCMPCVEFVGCDKRFLRSKNWRWRPIIEIETGRIVNWKQGITAEIHYKVCDDFECDILDENKHQIISYEGYVPKIMCPKDSGFGDYIIMDIDENGFIKGWEKRLIEYVVRCVEEQTI